MIKFQFNYLQENEERFENAFDTADSRTPLIYRRNDIISFKTAKQFNLT